MGEKQLLLGDEAVALGAVHAGLSGVYAYPGTPSTEITEFIQTCPLAAERKIHSNWSSNEKTAMEAALGMSYMGKRAMVCMKHVGMNVAADAFVNSAMTGTNGGLIVVAADDPSMHSSQNEQDSRFYGKFAMIPVFEPSNQQEAYRMMADAFDFSERYKTPVLMRMVTRMAHSRAVVETGSVRDMNAMSYPSNPGDWVLMPAVARKRNVHLIALQQEFLEASENSIYNKVEDFAMEFYADGRGRVVFAGYSVFHTGGSGMYAGNDLLSDEKILQKLSAYVPQEEFIRLRTRLEEELSALFGGFYHGYLGVDMMICHFPDEAPVYRIHPCVEINLRMNMGVVAWLLTDRYLAADAEGVFRIDYYPLAGQALEEHRQMSASFPLSVENNRVCAGYLPLVPVTPQSRYRAFLLLTLPQ